MLISKPSDDVVLGFKDTIPARASCTGKLGYMHGTD